MSYNIRILPVEEWDKLPGLDHSLYDEQHTNIMVIERAGEIIAHWALMPIYHAEGLWVREDYRKNPAIIRKLLRGMKAMAHTVDTPYIVTMAEDKEVAKLLDKLPSTNILHGDFYAIAFED